MMIRGALSIMWCFLLGTGQAFVVPTTARTTTKLSFAPMDQEIGLWTFAFASSHIGMSAIRRDIIQGCGQVAASLELVNNPNWRLPDLWPGDQQGGQAIFPTTEIAGRQLYRILYTAVSFATLGSAFFAYLESLHQTPPQVQLDHSMIFWISVLSWAVSITSLLNPSPLSLVPVYEASGKSNYNNMIQRNDEQKLTAYGMTRITRHPLILPVVSWGLATAHSLGGQPRDYLLFGGLALYAVAGCFAQDLRVSQQEGSVGTVFQPGENLQTFFQETSFVPFQAVADGRQSLSDIVKEVPWWASVVGIAIGYKLQSFLLDWIVSQAA